MKLLRNRSKDGSFTISVNNGENNNIRIVLHPKCGFKPGDKVYQLLHDDGRVILADAKNYLIYKTMGEIEGE